MGPWVGGSTDGSVDRYRCWSMDSWVDGSVGDIELLRYIFGVSTTVTQIVSTTDRLLILTRQHKRLIEHRLVR